MSNREKTPIAVMAEMLAEMADRAMEAERERDAAKEDAQNWFVISQTRDQRRIAAEETLAKEVEAHRKTKERLRRFVGEDIDDEERGEVADA